MVQNEKKFHLLCSISQESYIIWFSFMVFMFKMIIPPGVFFFFFLKILIFWVVTGQKGQKMEQNDDKFCLSCLISQEPYIIWPLFVVLKDNTSRCFSIFSKFWFFGLLGVSKGKNGPKWQKNCPLHFISQKPYII